jgi:hypothetical protein
LETFKSQKKKSVFLKIIIPYGFVLFSGATDAHKCIENLAALATCLCLTSSWLDFHLILTFPVHLLFPSGILKSRLFQSLDFIEAFWMLVPKTSVASKAKWKSPCKWSPDQYEAGKWKCL